VREARRSNRRIRLLLLTFTLVFLVAFGRAFWLQGVRAQSLGRLAAGQHRQEVTIPAHRGTIYDRTGVQLALGEQATTVYADPRQVTQPQVVAVAAARALGVDPNELYRELTDQSRGFVYVARQADPDAAARLARRKLDGLGFYPEERRTYPHRREGAAVVGYAGVDNDGVAGLEVRYDRVLAGQAGVQTIVRDPFGRAIDILRSHPERDGTDIRLTLDQRIQATTEAALQRVVSRWDAKGATAVIMDPRDGSILAMANAPGFDANRFPQTPQAVQRNRTVTDTFEPGSTFKIVTVGGVLSDGLVTPSTTFTLAPEIKVSDRWIHDAEARGTITYSVKDILAHSSNVGTVTLGEMLARQEHGVTYWISRFGFGHKTGIDFPGESAGIVVPPEKWSGSTIGNVPIGHGIAVTPVQMAAAYAAIANHGVWTQPHLVERIGSARPHVRRRRIVTGRVARQLTEMLRDVVIEGTGTKAEVPGYQVAGKTGTAAKPNPWGGYSSTRYIASFVGFVPASKPRLVILVTVDEPKGAIYGGMVAAPAFQEIAKFDLQYLEVPPDAPGAASAAG